MSVSLQDPPVFASSNPDLTQGNTKADDKSSRSAPAALVSNGSSAANVNFHSHAQHSGPVFGNHPPVTDRHHPANHHHHHHHAPHHGHHHGAALPPGFMHKLQQMLAHLFGGHWPSRPGNSIGNPYPPAPGRPDPHYSSKSPAELTRQLCDNFSAFEDPRFPGRVSASSIYAMANRGWSSNPVVNDNIRLANELLRRPDLMKAFDRPDSNGQPDGLISRFSLNAVLTGNNQFRYTTDKQLAREMLTHFNELNGGRLGHPLSFSDLRNIASRSLTGDKAQDHLIQLAQEALKRVDVLRVMDNLDSHNYDGRISWQALLKLSR